MSLNQARYAEGHVLTAAALIGSLALLLVAGLGVLRLSDQADAAIAGAVSHALQQDGSAGLPKTLPDWVLWLATALVAYGLAFAMLGVPGTWRRIVLWLTTLVLVAAWAPVMGLAAHAPQIATPLIAAVWSGACSLVYVRSHRMPCDESQP